jgi:hypothetical protein
VVVGVGSAPDNLEGADSASDNLEGTGLALDVLAGALGGLAHCHVSSWTGRVLQVFHMDYHWDRLCSYRYTSLTLAASLLSCDVSGHV